MTSFIIFYRKKDIRTKKKRKEKFHFLICSIFQIHFYFDNNQSEEIQINFAWLKISQMYTNSFYEGLGSIGFN